VEVFTIRFYRDIVIEAPNCSIAINDAFKFFRSQINSMYLKIEDFEFERRCNDEHS